jgi:leucyl-tRNA synthetase
MSKSRGNVVNPDEVIEKFGADTFRMYEMFMGPFEDAAPWSTKGVLGVHRFLNRFWNWAQNNIEALKKEKIETSKKALEIIHQTIKKVSEDIISFNFNTAVSAFMILLNNLENEKISKTDLELVLKIMYPFAPHICQELWFELGNETYIDFEKWPEYDVNIINQQKINLVIQINGRVRDVLEVQKGLSKEEALNLAMSLEKIQKIIKGKNILKTIYVQDKVLNIII